ncbi:WXG100 family type VII secretion target [Nonomuraea jiangxiensis]|uniref:Proteins of 100 residues with WXG n=1 Tax=Nonomuraea jiangxiensis TaxID=633440 RepID=A0A1G8FIA5_9ACTN|nr:WXG100 family type VII secretion target [Nonomuraea jiangxiensis]SDH81825.1 Proteins of 100 residues with WXG [Nonomuraea jiangxiensis]
MGDTRQETHHLKSPGASLGDDNPSNRNVEQVLTFLQGFDASRIDSASIAYSDAHQAVSEAKAAIEREARELAKVWEGNASVEAQKALGILYVTLGELAEKLKGMSTPLSDFANVVRKHQAFLNDDWGGFMLPTWHYQGFWNGGLVGSASFNDDWTDYYSTYTGVYGGDSTKGQWGSQNELAGQHLQTFGNDLKHVFSSMPDTLNVALRNIKPPTPLDDRPQPVNYPFDGGGPGVGGVMPASYNDPALSGDPSGGLDPNSPPYGSMDPSTDSMNPPGGSTDPGSDPSTDPTYPGADSQTDPSAGANATMANTGQNPGGITTTGSGQQSHPTTRLQDYQPPNTSSFPTTNGGAGSTPTYTPATYGGGSGTSTGGSGVAAAMGPSANVRGGTTGMGMPFMPMGMGGAGGQESSDRESSTWLHEDDDVWGGDADSAVNSRIG